MNQNWSASFQTDLMKPLYSVVKFKILPKLGNSRSHIAELYKQKVTSLGNILESKPLRSYGCRSYVALVQSLLQIKSGVKIGGWPARTPQQRGVH